MYTTLGGLRQVSILDLQQRVAAARLVVQCGMLTVCLFTGGRSEEIHTPCAPMLGQIRCSWPAATRGFRLPQLANPPPRQPHPQEPDLIGKAVCSFDSYSALGKSISDVLDNATAGSPLSGPSGCGERQPREDRARFAFRLPGSWKKKPVRSLGQPSFRVIPLQASPTTTSVIPPHWNCVTV